MQRRFSIGVITITAIVVVLAVGITVATLSLLNKAKPFIPKAGCVVKTPEGERELDIEQAQIAATIAAVGARRKLPERAVVIAYATAIQESKLFNLTYGDRDSVGVFQQRESQGWGSKKKIMDPVYATNRFFAALVKVKDYRTIPIADAAQAVQRSAGGYAYADHETDATILAGAFTGRVPRAVRCTFVPEQAPSPAPASKTDAARKGLVRALGGATAEGGSISAPSTRRGWLIATWSVAHAQRYNLRSVSYDGVTWSAAKGADGWTPGKATTARVELM